MIYLIVFAISVFFLNLSCQSKYKGNIIGFLFFLAAVSAPVYLAACRDYMVGKDTLSYLRIFGDAIESRTIKQYFNAELDIEKGFLVVTYLVSRITVDYSVYLGICHLLIVLPVYCVLRNLSNDINPALGALIFLLLFYNESLNLTRQYISIAFITLSLPYLFQERYFKSLICLSIAVSFHVTALIGLILPFYYILSKRYSLKKHVIFYVASIILFVVFFFSLQKIGLLSSFGDEMEEKLEGYIGGSSSGMSVSNSTLLLYLLVFPIMILAYIRQNYDKSKLTTFMMAALFAVLTVLLSPIARPLYRLSLDFSVVSSISIPFVYSSSRKRRLNEYSLPTIFLYVFIAFCLVYWIFSVIVRGSNDTFPYSSSILNL